MSRVDRIREEISFKSKLLVIAISIIVVTVGGLANLLLRDNAGLFTDGWFGIWLNYPVVFIAIGLGVVEIVAVSVILFGLANDINRRIEQIGDL